MEDLGEFAKKLAKEVIFLSKDESAGRIIRKGIIGLYNLSEQDFLFVRKEMNEYFFQIGCQGINIVRGKEGYHVNVSYYLDILNNPHQ